MLVDDEPGVLDVYRRVLEDAGFRVECAHNGREALDRFAPTEFDSIVSDIAMPELGGIGLLRGVRERDLDVPVILVTGLPDVDTAIQAVDLGAMRYLVKPVRARELVDTVRYACGLRRISRVHREALEYQGRRPKPSDRAGLEAALERARSDLWVAFQPIVRFSRRRVDAYEALVRCGEPLLAEPLALFEAATELGQVESLGAQIRERIAESMAVLDESVRVFANVHPLEMGGPSLFSTDSPLAPYAERIVLEISEQQPLHEVGELRSRLSRLRALGYGIAIDDLGAGYAGLGSFVHLEPDVAKLDHVLIRGIENDPVKQKIAGSMVRLCADIGVAVVAEAVETTKEFQTLQQLGADLFQGYAFARPAPGFPDVPAAAFELESQSPQAH